MLLANLVKVMPKFGNSCKKPILLNSGPENAKIWQVLSENANSGHFDGEISLAKGIIFTKIGLANGPG